MNASCAMSSASSASPATRYATRKATSLYCSTRRPYAPASPRRACSTSWRSSSSSPVASSGRPSIESMLPTHTPPNGEWFRLGPTRRMLDTVQVQALPIPPNLLSIPGVRPLELEVASASDLGPRMRRIELTAPSLAKFEYQAGQDVMLVLGQAGERALSRRYSIRSHDPHTGTLELNVVAHGVEGIGAMWAANAAPGDRVNGVGPRGKISLNPGADWHLFLGDETAGPVTLNMIEALPDETPAFGFVEVIDGADELPYRKAGQHQVTWLHRGAASARSSTLLKDALQAFDFPAGRGHVYLNGEVVLVSDLKRAVVERGLDAEQVSFKAYWGRGKANAGNGEPEQRPA